MPSRCGVWHCSDCVGHVPPSRFAQHPVHPFTPPPMHTHPAQELLDCWQASGSAAPLNVAFIVEGEEENGSTGFMEALQV